MELVSYVQKKEYENIEGFANFIGKNVLNKPQKTVIVKNEPHICYLMDEATKNRTVENLYYARSIISIAFPSGSRQKSALRPDLLMV